MIRWWIKFEFFFILLVNIILFRWCNEVVCLVIWWVIWWIKVLIVSCVCLWFLCQVFFRICKFEERLEIFNNFDFLFIMCFRLFRFWLVWLVIQDIVLKLILLLWVFIIKFFSGVIFIEVLIFWLLWIV